jgi:hypothetical protein
MPNGGLASICRRCRVGKVAIGWPKGILEDSRLISRKCKILRLVPQTWQPERLLGLPGLQGEEDVKIFQRTQPVFSDRASFQDAG